MASATSGVSPQPYAVIFPFLGRGVGGSHLSTFRLGRALNAYFGVRSVVLCVEGSPIATEAARHGLDVAFTGERPASRNSPLYDLTQVGRRMALLARCGNRRSIVHTNDIAATQAWAPCAKLMGRKVVYHHRSLNSASLKIRLRLALADAIIAVSELCLRNIEHQNPSKVSLIFNGYSTDGVDRVAARRRLLRDGGLQEEAVLVGFVANFHTRKRPYFFLDAARSIVAREPRARFLMFGRDSHVTKRDLERHAEKLGLLSSVIFMGFRTPPEDNIAALDVLLAPAINEPAGSTPIEALLLGTPYVATADAGHVGSAQRWGGGVLVPKEASPQEFAETVLRVTSGEISPVLSPERRAEIARELAPRAHAEAVLAVYRRLLPPACGATFFDSPSGGR